MKKVLRIDRARIDTFVRNGAGFIQTPAYLTKTGVLVYKKPDGSVIRELRHPDDVFNIDSIRTLKGVPLTNDHPQRLVDVKNIKALSVGYVGDSINQDGEFLKADTVTIFDEATMLKIEAGKVELSCGYEAELEETPGEYNGEAYDVRQRNITYNHVSIVDEGRAGPQVRLRLDSNDAIVESIADKYINSTGDLKMEKITINGQEFEVSPELKVVLEKMMGESQVSMDELAKLKSDLMEAPPVEAAKPSEVEIELQKSLDAQTAKVDEVQAKLDSVLEENKKIKTDSTDEKMINTLAEEKMKVIAIARHVLKEAKFDGLTNLEIKKNLLEAKGVDLTGKSSVYVEARYDALAETLGEEISAIKTFGENVITRHDSVRSADEARKESMERSRNAWIKK